MTASLHFRSTLFATIATSLFLPLPDLAHADNSPQPTLTNISARPSTSNPQLDAMLTKAEQHHLESHRTWLRLLYYPEHTKAGDKKFKSRMPSADFFVSPNGATDPKQEMQAMLAALLSQDFHNTPASQAVQCRFPARTHWLKQQLGISDKQVPTIDCPEFNHWLGQINPSSASLVFAEEYLDNPASMFGHSFLRLDNATSQQAYILNYMPKAVPNEAFIKSSYNALIAGATGEFTIEPYEQKIRQYRDDEGRDVWRYPLNLSATELQQLARQIWEIKDQQPTYYLMKDNCASEILLLLNSLRPEKNYLKNFHAIVSPADLLRELQRQGVLTDAIYEPSTKAKKQASLNVQNIHNQANIQGNISLSLISPDQTLNLLPADNNPQFAHPLGRLTVGMGDQTHHFTQAEKNKSASQSFGEVGYRLVYHDDLDSRSGYPAGFSLEALGFKLRMNQDNDTNHFKNDKVELQSFDLIKARSLNPINTAESGKSWGGHLSALQQSDGDKQHLVASIGGEYGWSIAYGTPKLGTTQIPPNLCYALGTGTAQLGKGLEKGYRLGVGTNLGCIQQLGEKMRAKAEIALPFWYQGERTGYDSYWQPVATLGLQYDINHHQALRLNTSYTWQAKQPLLISNKGIQQTIKLKNTDEMSLQYLHYF